MGIIDRTKKAAGAVAAASALVNVTINDVHREVDLVTFAGIPLFKRDERGNPRVLGIPFKRRRPPRADNA